MSKQLEGYAIYLEKCEQYGLEPVSLRHFVKQLTPDQLATFKHSGLNDEGI